MQSRETLDDRSFVLPARLDALPRNAWLGLLLALTALSRLPLFLTELIDIDEAVWWAAAKMWLAGGTPFIDFIDNKAHGIYALYALPQLLGFENLYAMHVLTLFWTAGIALALGGTVAEVAREKAAHAVGLGRLAALLFILLTATGNTARTLAMYTETAGLLPLAAGLWLYVRARLDRGRDYPRLLAAGALVVAAALFRQTYLIVLPVFGLELLWSRYRETDEERAPPLGWLARWAAFGAGGLLVFGLFLAYLLATDTAALAWEWLIAWNAGYMSYDAPLSYKFQRFTRNVLPMVTASLPAWIGLFGGLAFLRDLRSPVQRLFLFFSLLALALMYAASMGGRWHPHYYIPVAALLSVVIATLWALDAGHSDPFRTRIMGAALPLAAVVMIASVSVGSWRTIAGKYKEVDPMLVRTAERVQELTAADERIYIWGFGGVIYYRARRLPASRFLAPLTSISGYLFGGANKAFPDLDPASLVVEEHWNRFMGDLRRSPPALFLDYAENDIHNFGRHKLEQYPELHQWLEDNYKRLPDRGPIVFYRLNASDTALPNEPGGPILGADD